MKIVSISQDFFDLVDGGAAELAVEVRITVGVVPGDAVGVGPILVGLGSGTATGR